MSRFTNNLWSDLAREHGETLAHTERPEAARSRLQRPRVFAGGTLGLAGVGAALLVALGGSAAPAYAVTTNGDGSVTVELNYVTNQNLPQLNAKLASLGTGEAISIQMARGAATTDGTVTCTPAPGVSGAPVKVLVGGNGTEVINAGQSGGNTAEGSFHLVSCTTYNASADAGNSGSGSSANGGDITYSGAAVSPGTRTVVFGNGSAYKVVTATGNTTTTGNTGNS